VVTGTQKLVRLAIAIRGIDPLPGGRGMDEVKRLGLAVPGLERFHVDLDRKTVRPRFTMRG